MPSSDGTYPEIPFHDFAADVADEADEADEVNIVCDYCSQRGLTCTPCRLSLNTTSQKCLACFKKKRACSLDFNSRSKNAQMAKRQAEYQKGLRHALRTQLAQSTANTTASTQLIKALKTRIAELEKQLETQRARAEAAAAICVRFARAVRESDQRAMQRTADLVESLKFEDKFGPGLAEIASAWKRMTQAEARLGQRSHDVQ